MKAIGHPSVGLLGRLLAILLLTLAVEFGAGTLFYERASRALVRDDEAHRLAEHLAIARTLVSGQPIPDRPAMAERLTTDRYLIHWSGRREGVAVPAPDPAIRARVLEWEPGLADGDLRVQLAPFGRAPRLFGAVRLADGSWLRFRAIAPEEAASIGSDRLLALLVPTVLLLVLSALMFRLTLRPIRMLARASERVGQGHDLTLPEAGPGEVRGLIRAFNAMQARIHQLISDRTQALAAVGHDLRTPLARLQLRTDAIADPAVRRAFATDVAEMEAMVGSLLSYLGGEDDPEAAVRTDVAVLVATIADDAADRGGDAAYLGQDHLEASVRPLGLKRAVSNLLENALHYGHCARLSVRAEAAVIVIRIDDDGPGIPEDRLDQVLQPFTRLDPARGRNTQGLGLGLAIVVRAAELEGGRLVLANRDRGGLRAELHLPLR